MLKIQPLWCFKPSRDWTVTQTLCLFSVSILILFLLPAFHSPPPFLSLSLSLFESLVTMLAYPPHHMLVILSISGKFTCLMLFPNIVLLYAGTLALIKINCFKPIWSITSHNSSIVHKHRKYISLTAFTHFIFVCIHCGDLQLHDYYCFYWLK